MRGTIPAMENLMGSDSYWTQGDYPSILRKMVDRFNSLPRDEEVPSGGALNMWTISIQRPILMDEMDEEAGSYAKRDRVVFLTTPNAGYSLSSHCLGDDPDSEEEEIEEIVFQLLYLFSGFDMKKGLPVYKTQYVPWQWKIDDVETGRLICERLKQLGVQHKELLEMERPNEEDRERTQQKWIWYRDHCFHEWLNYKEQNIRVSHKKAYNDYCDLMRGAIYPGLHL